MTPPPSAATTPWPRPPPRAARLRRQAAGRTIGDVAELAAWFTKLTRTTRKRRTGGMRSPTTTYGYELTLVLFAELAATAKATPPPAALPQRRRAHALRRPSSGSAPQT